MTRQHWLPATPSSFLWPETVSQASQVSGRTPPDSAPREPNWQLHQCGPRCRFSPGHRARVVPRLPPAPHRASLHTGQGHGTQRCGAGARSGPGTTWRARPAHPLAHRLSSQLHRTPHREPLTRAGPGRGGGAVSTRPHPQPGSSTPPALSPRLHPTPPVGMGRVLIEHLQGAASACLGLQPSWTAARCPPSVP